MDSRGKHVPNRPLKMWHGGVAVITVAVVLVMSGLTYTNRSIDNSNKRWCPLVVLLDNRNQQLPPSDDPDTMTFRREIHNLRVAYGC
jgi:hypothetical protein